jgi:hypothetical protein
MLPCHVGFGNPSDVRASWLCAHHVVVKVVSSVAISEAFHILEEDSNVISIQDMMGVSVCTVDAKVDTFPIVASAESEI